MDEIQIYEWTNITWILHLPINMCVKYVFNAWYQCGKHTNYELIIFCMISIVKLWNVKFVMKGTNKHTKGCQKNIFWMLGRILKDDHCTMNDLRGVQKHEGDVINNYFGH